MRLNTIVISLLLLNGVRPAVALPEHLLLQLAEWHRNDEGLRMAENILSWQSDLGSWPKNADTFSGSFDGDQESRQGTFDNGATTDELRFLARAFNATGEARFHEAFLKGLDHILEAQYPNGGWPQFFPPGPGYHRHITFNDNVVVRLLDFLRETVTSSDYAFVGPERREAVKASFDRGIRCILDCQIEVRGTLTVWCAQHDEVDLRPRPARSFELESLSGSESAAVLKLLMSLESPDEDVQRAIHAGAAWFESSKITGIRVQDIDGDRVVVEDENAPPLWARFYNIETNGPFFCGRDGVKKQTLAEIDAERRNGYAWYGDWGHAVATTYSEWKTKFPVSGPEQ